MTCKECLCFEVCKNKWAYEMNLFGFGGRCYMEGMEEKCEFFKPKSRFVELPCGLGQKVYCIPFKNHLYEVPIVRVAIERIKGEVVFAFLCSGGVCFDSRDIGKTAFLTRKQAEKALKEREKE